MGQARVPSAGTGFALNPEQRVKTGFVQNRRLHANFGTIPLISAQTPDINGLLLNSNARQTTSVPTTAHLSQFELEHEL